MFLWPLHYRCSIVEFAILLLDQSPSRNDQLSYLSPSKNGKALQKYVNKSKQVVDGFMALNQVADWSSFYMSIETN